MSDEPAPKDMSPPDDRAGETGKPRMELAADVLRRVLYTGVGALFATEEGLRKVAGDLPKEAASFLVSQAQHTKDEVLRVVANELRRFLDGVDLEGVARKVLSQVTLEVKTQIRFVPNEPDGKAEIKRKISLRRRDGDEK